RSSASPSAANRSPGIELAVDILGERLAALGEALDLFGDVDRRIVLHVAQLLDTGFELRDRLLELEEGGLHVGSVFYRQRIERAPEVPGGDRAPRPPGFAHPGHGAHRHLAAVEVRAPDALLQAE